MVFREKEGKASLLATGIEKPPPYFLPHGFLEGIFFLDFRQRSPVSQWCVAAFFFPPFRALLARVFPAGRRWATSSLFFSPPLGASSLPFLPARRARVLLAFLRGRGACFPLEFPSRDNHFSLRRVFKTAALRGFPFPLLREKAHDTF